MTEREAPPDRGFDHQQNDPYEDDGWFGSEQVAEPTPQFAEPAPPVTEPAPVDPVPEVPAPSRSEPAHHVPVARYEATREAPRAPAPPARRLFSPTVSTWTVNGQLRASDNSTLTFRAPPPPWYRTRPAKVALMAVATAAVAVPIVMLAFRGDSSTAPEQSTSVAPKPSTSAQPAPSSVPPTPINLPPPLPPPPPPPPPPAPPTEDTGSAPTYNQPEWTRSAPPPAQKPEVGVTRAPISVAPVPRRPPEGHVGESNKPGCGGWC